MSGLKLLCSYHKSGNTWLRAVLSEYLFPSNGQPAELEFHFPVWAHRMHFDTLMSVDSSKLNWEEIESARHRYCRALAQTTGVPMFWKVHDCFWASQPQISPPFPPDCLAKVVYLVRDPRDVSLSFANHLNLSVDETIEIMADEHNYFAISRKRLRSQLPQFLSSWSRHVTSWLDAPIDPCVIRYEDMLANPFESFSHILRYLEIEAQDDRLAQVIELCKFENLRSREEQFGFSERPKGTQRFFREGRAGAWQVGLNPDQIARIQSDHGEVMRRLAYLT